MALPVDWDLPREIVDRLGETAGRQRAMAAQGHVLLILHRVPTDSPRREGVYFWRKPDGSWVSGKGEDGLAALRRHMDEYQRRIDALDAAHDAAADAAATFAVLREAEPVHRAVRNLHATMQQARELCGDDRDVITLRDRADEMQRSLDLLHVDIKNALDYAVALQAERQLAVSNEMAAAGHRLSALAAVFLPLTAIAAVFGMNLVSGLEGVEGVFWAVLTAAGIAAGVIAWRLTGSAAGRSGEGRGPAGRPPGPRSEGTRRRKKA